MKHSSPILDLHDFLITIGELDAPMFAEEEREMIARLDNEGLLGDASQLRKLLNIPEPTEGDFYRPLVSAEEWISNPYYFPGADNIYPLLRDDFINIFNPKAGVHDVFLTGSIGYGKSWFAAILLLYGIYKLSTLRNPQKFVGLDETTAITFNALSITGKQAKTAVFHYLKEMVDHSPYFDNHFPRQKDVDSALRFPNNILALPGNSQETSAIGLGVFSASLDEANFLVSASKQAHEKMAAKETSHAMNLYRALKRRIESRFKHSPPMFRGLLITLSSRVTKDDFIDQQIKKVSDGSGQLTKGYYVVEHSQWSVRGFEKGRPNYDRKTKETIFSGDTFRVVVGGPGQASTILGEKEFAEENSEIIDVPVEYRASFEQDLDGSIRDIAGRGTHALNPWFLSQAVQRQIIDNYQGQPLEHPWSDDTDHGMVGGQVVNINLDKISTKSVTYEGRMRKTRVEKRVPIRSPEMPRFIGVDLAKNQDALGFAMGYCAGWKEIKRVDKTDPLNKDIIVERVPITLIEALANVRAPVGGVLEPADVRELIYMIRDAGFYIEKVLVDQYQSLDTINILNGQGITAVEHSVDRNIGPYTQFKNGVAEGTIFYYDHKTLIREMTKVQRVVSPGGRVKVDHPEMDFDNPNSHRGSKDVLDAACHVVSAICEEYTAVAGGEGQMTLEIDPVMNLAHTEQYNPSWDPDTPEGDMDAWILDIARGKR